MLDTHVAIWAVSEPDRLPAAIQALIADHDNTVHVSAVSIFEISIKFRLKKRSAPPFSGRRAIEMFREVGYSLLEVGAEHAASVDELPEIHGDPFDRLLAAQALAEPMRLVTHDRKLAAYSDTTITW